MQYILAFVIVMLSFLVFILFKVQFGSESEMTNKNEYTMGYWNGEPAMFRVVLGIIDDQPKEMEDHFKKYHPNGKQYLWFKPFIGQQRQVVEVIYDDNKFYLDNEDGTGLYKVTTGQGSPTVSHATVYISEVLSEIPNDFWQHTSPEVRQIIKDEVDRGWMKLDPEGYKELKQKQEEMRKNMRAFHKSVSTLAPA